MHKPFQQKAFASRLGESCRNKLEILLSKLAGGSKCPHVKNCVRAHLRFEVELVIENLEQKNAKFNAPLNLGGVKLLP